MALDIAVKNLFLAHAADWNGKAILPRLLDLHYAWNHGVSFSLFWQNSGTGSMLLAAVLSIVIIGMAVAAFRTHKQILATALGRRLIRLQCYEGLDVSSAVYEWNYAAQMIEIRMEEAAGAVNRADM